MKSRTLQEFTAEIDNWINDGMTISICAFKTDILKNT